MSETPPRPEGNEERNRIVSLTLNLPSTSNADAVRQFISAVGIYGMGAFDFQVYDGDEDMVYVDGREAMLETMPSLNATPDEEREERIDDVRTEVRSDLLNDDDEEPQG